MSSNVESSSNLGQPKKVNIGSKPMMAIKKSHIKKTSDVPSQPYGNVNNMDESHNNNRGIDDSMGGDTH